jgi:methanogen homocitrate synthase
MNDPLVMFGTHPSLTGKTGEVVLGKKSGKASIIYKMGELGMGALEDKEIVLILDEVKAAGIAKRDVLTNEEFANIVTAVVAR